MVPRTLSTYHHEYFVFYRRQVFEPPPRRRHEYATLPAALPLRRQLPAFVSRPLVGIVGVITAVGLTLALTTSRDQLRFSANTVRPRSEPASAVARTDPWALQAAPLKVPKHTSPSGVRDRAQGVARFEVRTPGAQVTIHKSDMPGSDQFVANGVVRLPVGRWIVNATAPGFRPYKATLSVKVDRTVSVVVKLRQDRHSGRQRHSSARA